jgi:hypothetical protein
MMMIKNGGLRLVMDIKPFLSYLTTFYQMHKLCSRNIFSVLLFHSKAIAPGLREGKMLTFESKN